MPKDKQAVTETENAGTDEPKEISEAQKEAARILEDAKKAVAKMLADAKKTVDAAKLEASASAPEKTPDNLNNPMRLVPVTLFKDNERYKDDLFVSLESGRTRLTYQIQRGFQVMVPYCIKKQIEEMDAQGNKAAMLIEKLSNQFRENSKALGE